MSREIPSIKALYLPFVFDGDFIRIFTIIFYFFSSKYFRLNIWELHFWANVKVGLLILIKISLMEDVFG